MLINGESGLILDNLYIYRKFILFFKFNYPRTNIVIRDTKDFPKEIYCTPYLSLVPRNVNLK